MAYKGGQKVQKVMVQPIVSFLRVEVVKFDLHAKQFTASVDVDNSANSSHSKKLNPSMTVTWWYGPCYRHVDKCVSFFQCDPFYKHIFDSTALILLGCFQCFVLRSASMPNYRSPN